jgi:hypothetical protein
MVATFPAGALQEHALDRRRVEQYRRVGLQVGNAAGLGFRA